MLPTCSQMFVFTLFPNKLLHFVKWTCHNESVVQSLVIREGFHGCFLNVGLQSFREKHPLLYGSTGIVLCYALLSLLLFSFILACSHCQDCPSAILCPSTCLRWWLVLVHCSTRRFGSPAEGSQGSKRRGGEGCSAAAHSKGRSGILV